MLKEIIIAIQAYFQAHRFIRQHGLWKWIIIPGIIYASLFVVSMYYFSHTSSNFIQWMALKTGISRWLERIDNSFLGFLFIMGNLLLWLILMLFYFSLFKYIILIVGSPLFAYLSQKTEAIIEGRRVPFTIKHLWQDVKRGVAIAGRNCLWQTVYVLSILLLILIPLVGWLTPILAVLVECYYYGFSMLDYSMKRHQRTQSESIFFIGNHKGLAIGNGLIFYMMHLVPVLGWVLAPAYSVIAATLSMHPLKHQEK